VIYSLSPLSPEILASPRRLDGAGGGRRARSSDLTARRSLPTAFIETDASLTDRRPAENAIDILADAEARAHQRHRARLKKPAQHLRLGLVPKRGGGGA